MLKPGHYVTIQLPNNHNIHAVVRVVENGDGDIFGGFQLRVVKSTDPTILPGSTFPIVDWKLEKPSFLE